MCSRIECTYWHRSQFLQNDNILSQYFENSRLQQAALIRPINPNEETVLNKIHERTL